MRLSVAAGSGSVLPEGDDDVVAEGLKLAAGVAGLAKLATHAFDWYVPLLILPLMFLVQRSFRLYFQSLRENAGRQGHYAMAAGAGRG